MRSGTSTHEGGIAPWPRRFSLVREVDVSAVSGTGAVADGAQFADGSVALWWRGEHPCTSVWRSIDDVAEVHGHAGSTRVAWIDPPASAGCLPDRGRR